MVYVANQLACFQMSPVTHGGVYQTILRIQWLETIKNRVK